MGVQSTVLINCGVPGILSQHLEAFGFVEVFVAGDDPVAAEDVIDLFGPSPQEATFAHHV